MKKTFGKIPMYKGDWTPGVVVKNKFRFTYRGSELQATRDDLTTPPLDENDNLNDGWIYISNGTAAYRANERIERLEKLTYDASAGGATFESLQQALESVPEDYQIGGLTIKFINSTTGDYEQFQLKKPEWSTSLEDWVIVGGKYLDDNPEFLEATLDEEGKVVEGTQKDGTKDIEGNLRVTGYTKLLGKVFFGGSLHLLCENPEWIRVLTDEFGKVLCGIRRDGGFVAHFEGIVSVVEFKKFVTLVEEQISSLNSIIFVEENSEYISAELDSEDNILSGRRVNGVKVENVGFETPFVSAKKASTKSLNIDGVEKALIEDLEGRVEINADTDDRIVNYRDSQGMLHENKGIKTPKLIVDSIECESVYNVDFSKVEKDATIYAERPKFGEIWFEGGLPTDMSDERKPTQLTMTFKNSGVPQFRCNCTLAIQGHGSAGYEKKGYTLEPYNADWKAINIKFGDMIAIDSFHLKAYYTDNLHCRDMANFNIWRDMIKQLDYPYSKFNQIPFALDTEYNKNKIDIADAKYAPDGFPVVCYLNGEFLGLYTIKLKKSRQNYAMEKSMKSQIFMDAVNYSGHLNGGFEPYGWDVKNPKMKNYEEGGEVPDAKVLASINRFFDWMNQVNVNDESTYSDYADYLNMPHWIVFMIFEELVFSEDIINNNINLACWDAETNVGHWTIIPYDTDLCLGLHPWEINGQYNTILTELDRFVLSGDIWTKFKVIFLSEIKSMWTKLRNSGFITPQNIVKYYIEQCKCIPRDVYAKDREVWGNLWTNGNTSIEQIYNAIEYRINWLDGHWMNNNN